jgi:hypothetical protein
MHLDVAMDVVIVYLRGIALEGPRVRLFCADGRREKHPGLSVRQCR